MVIVFDEMVLESWYGIFGSVLSYGIIFGGFARNGKKTWNGFRSTKYSTRGV